MAAAAFIAGDWGTSHLRLSLCDARGRVLESTHGPGISSVKGRVEEAFFEQIAVWDRHGKLPAMLCGMVGSSIGWREVPYLPAPLRPEAITKGLLHFQARGRAIALAPGLSCRNRLQAPDFMRGEETQILGATKLEPSLMQGRQVLCMPGTHTKWASLKDGVIEHFLTAVSGELYDILHKHSVLVNNGGGQDIAGGPTFERALEQTRMFPDAELIHLLFQNRSRQLQGELKTADAGAYLSGLIIGQDVSGARRFFRNDMAEAKDVVVIGTPRLTALYSQALKTREIGVRAIDGDTASLAGLAALYQDAMETISHVG
jgi:2-dehydro-3-deoxygalactonokinase